jgi:hypothetical protein
MAKDREGGAARGWSRVLEVDPARLRHAESHDAEHRAQRSSDGPAEPAVSRVVPRRADQDPFEETTEPPERTEFVRVEAESHVGPAAPSEDPTRTLFDLDADALQLELGRDALLMSPEVARLAGVEPDATPAVEVTQINPEMLDLTATDDDLDPVLAGHVAGHVAGERPSLPRGRLGEAATFGTDAPRPRPSPGRGPADRREASPPALDDEPLPRASAWSEVGIDARARAPEARGAEVLVRGVEPLGASGPPSTSPRAVVPARPEADGELIRSAGRRGSLSPEPIRADEARRPRPPLAALDLPLAERAQPSASSARAHPTIALEVDASRGRGIGLDASRGRGGSPLISADIVANLFGGDTASRAVDLPLPGGAPTAAAEAFAELAKSPDSQDARARFDVDALRIGASGTRAAARIIPLFLGVLLMFAFLGVFVVGPFRNSLLGTPDRPKKAGVAEAASVGQEHTLPRGSLRLRSFPTRAMVEVDGFFIGRTPLLVAPPTDGQTYVVRLTAAGKLPVEVRVTHAEEGYVTTRRRSSEDAPAGDDAPTEPDGSVDVDTPKADPATGHFDLLVDLERK